MTFLLLLSASSALLFPTLPRSTARLTTRLLSLDINTPTDTTTVDGDDLASALSTVLAHLPPTTSTNSTTLTLKATPPTELPSLPALRSLVAFLPLTLTSYDPIPTLETIPVTLMPTFLRVRGPIASGYGRGSTKLGIPTANLPSSLFSTALQDMPTGVYIGWGLIEGFTPPPRDARADSESYVPPRTHHCV